MENKKEPKQEEQKMREIIIETDGNVINLKKSEVAGTLELSAILTAILNNLNK